MSIHPYSLNLCSKIDFDLKPAQIFKKCTFAGIDEIVSGILEFGNANIWIMHILIADILKLFTDVAEIVNW